MSSREVIRLCGCCGCEVASRAPTHAMVFCRPPASGGIDWSALCGKGALRPTRRTIRQAASAVASDATYRADAEEILRRAGAGTYWVRA